MMQPFEQMQTIGKDGMDTAMKTVGTIQKNAQTVAVETADYAKRSFEQGTAAMEKLVGVRTLDKAFEIQADYARQAYEGFVAQATRMGELYAGFVRETLKPMEAAVSRGAATVAR